MAGTFHDLRIGGITHREVVDVNGIVTVVSKRDPDPEGDVLVEPLLLQRSLVGWEQNAMSRVYHDPGQLRLFAAGALARQLSESNCGTEIHSRLKRGYASGLRFSVKHERRLGPSPVPARRGSPARDMPWPGRLQDR